MRNKRGSGAMFGIPVNAWLKACCVLTALCSVSLAADRRHRSKTLIPRDFFEGKELFEKSWEPGKPSPIGGDGLGPLYNETSCVGCHNLGGSGGGGSNDRNVPMLTAVASAAGSIKGATLFQGEMEDLHPGFRNSASIVLHRHATTPEIENRLRIIGTFTAVQTRVVIKTLREASRNTPALFGAGYIDAIPNQVLREAEKRSFPTFPEIKGRVSGLRDGRLGRFGWKAQVASLDDFVRAACSNELVLEVPGQHQVSLATAKDFDPSALKLDMDEAQINLLTRFVSRLAPPKKRPDDRTLPPWGYMVFQSVGCATCHAPKLGSSFAEVVVHVSLLCQPNARLFVGGGVLRGPGAQPVHIPIEHTERGRDQDCIVDRLIVSAFGTSPVDVFRLDQPAVAPNLFGDHQQGLHLRRHRRRGRIGEHKIDQPLVVPVMNPRRRRM
jgi:hypothetical protein